MRRIKNTPEGKASMSKASKATSTEVKSQTQVVRYQNVEERTKTSESTKRYFDNPDNTDAVSLSRSKANVTKWKNPEYAKARLKNMAGTKNKIETYFHSFFEDVLDYSSGVLVEQLTNGKYMTPDFQVKGTKKLIEVFGDYWHKDEDPIHRINAWKSLGYDCIVIWESSIKDDLDTVKTRVHKYVNDIV